jgi:hypothetical protein
MENTSYRSKSYFSRKGFDKNSPVRETLPTVANCAKMLGQNHFAKQPCFDFSLSIFCVQGHILRNPERYVILYLSLTGSLVWQKETFKHTCAALLDDLSSFSVTPRYWLMECKPWMLSYLQKKGALVSRVTIFL